MSKPADKIPTYEDILALPEGVSGEILDGQLYTSPRPSPIHQHAMIGISSPLKQKYGGGSGGDKKGWILLTEPQLHLAPQDIIPDVAGWKIENLPNVPKKVFAEPLISVNPDWVCEILSPSSGRRDRVLKRKIYLELKVGYYWIIDPLNQTIEAYKYESPSKWTEVGVYGGEEKARIEPFSDIDFELSTLWL
jgi:Uma2 family endonuclease